MQLAASHNDLQQLDTKTQTALVTILALTQVTELKLLLDAGPDGHAYYAFVLTLLVASIAVEALLTTVIIYIGNHRLDPLSGTDETAARLQVRGLTVNNDDDELSPKRRFFSAGGELDLVTGTVERNPRLVTSDLPALRLDDSEMDIGKTEVFLEVTRMRLADMELSIIGTANYVATLETVVRRCPDISVLTEELERKRDELKSAIVERDETEMERRKAEARLQRTLLVERQTREKNAMVIFRTVSCWQRTAAYLLYFVMLMNVFITAFGISGSHRANAAAAAQDSHVIIPPVALHPSLHPPSYRVNDSTTYY